MATLAPITIHIADLDEVRNLIGQLTLERDVAHQEAAELREQIPVIYGLGRDDEADGLPLRWTGAES